LKERRKLERETPEKFLAVFDERNGEKIGQLANISYHGAMLITPDPVKTNTLFHCRVELTRPIMDREVIVFQAQCRWCRKNVSSGRWESGYKLTLEGVNAEMLSYLILSIKLGHWGDKNLKGVDTVEMDNRRITDRYDLDRPLPVFEFNRYRQIGELADISPKGARLITDKPIKKGDRIRFRILLPRKIFRQEYLVFEGQCRWSRRDKDGIRYESGYEMVDIDETDSVIILHLMIHYAHLQPTEKRIQIVK